jgi:hypothetical protein
MVSILPPESTGRMVYSQRHSKFERDPATPEIAEPDQPDLDA